MNVKEVLKDHKRKKNAGKSRREVEEKKNRVEKELNPKKLKLYFYYERMEPFKWPDPRDLRAQLSKRMITKYKGQNISKIPLSTEFVLKFTRNEPVLKYKIVILDWDEGLETRKIKNIKFTEKMFRWVKEDQEFGIFDDV